MAQFIVAITGKFIVEAEDKDGAKEIAKGVLAARQPWLTTAYGDPERVGEVEEIPLDTLVK